MQSEESVEIDHRAARNIDGRPHGVIGRLAMRHDDIQSVGRAALEDHDQALVSRAGFDSRKSGARQKRRDRRGADNCERAVAKKNSARNT